MLEDRYGNPISTTTPAARDAYVEGVDLFIAANAGAEAAIRAAIAADARFALGHIALARFLQASGRGAEAAGPARTARALAGETTPRERAHIEALALLAEGKGTLAYPKIRAHLASHPRDVMTAQTCTGVFGLIGFSGQPGREAEQLAFTTALAPHYGDDWWFLSQHAFAQLEAGQTGPAAASIDRALAARPDSAHSVHVEAHLHYETGEGEAGLARLRAFWEGYPRSAQLHCHVSWHVALWALERDDIDTLWAVFDGHIAAGGETGPPLNVLTDGVAILYRAGLHGVAIPADRWDSLSDYALARFPRPGIAFADVHAALAHAMAGREEAFANVVRNAAGPAAEVVRAIALGFGAIAQGRFAAAVEHLAGVMAEHERIGGSRAQRDLVEYALAGALVRDGRADEACRLLRMRRPHTALSHAIEGLSMAA